MAQAADSLTCTGRFPNPITEICWSCILPISIGSDGNRTPTRYTGADATSSSLMFSLTYPTSVTAGGGRATNILTTHANATGDLGSFRIVAQSAIGAGVRRIEAQGIAGDFDLQRRAEEVPVAEYVVLAQAVSGSA